MPIASAHFRSLFWALTAAYQKSTADYIMVRQKDKAKVRNGKVISSEECVSKHKLLVMDMWFKATKSWRRKFKPRVRV